MIYMVGFMASGKTHWGRLIAEKLHREFIDLDEILEKEYSMSIAEMFSQWGEEEFRKIESEKLKSIQAGEKVVSTGGGTPCYFDNMDFLLEHGKVIFLNTPLDVLLQRISDEKAKRPVISQISDKNLESEISKLLEKRREMYANAHITVDTANSTIEEVINMLNS